MEPAIQLACVHAVIPSCPLGHPSEDCLIAHVCVSVRIFMYMPYSLQDQSLSKLTCIWAILIVCCALPCSCYRREQTPRVCISHQLSTTLKSDSLHDAWIFLYTLCGPVHKSCIGVSCQYTEHLKQLGRQMSYPMHLTCGFVWRSVLFASML